MKLAFMKEHIEELRILAALLGYEFLVKEYACDIFIYVYMRSIFDAYEIRFYDYGDGGIECEFKKDQILLDWTDSYFGVDQLFAKMKEAL